MDVDEPNESEAGTPSEEPETAGDPAEAQQYERVVEIGTAGDLVITLVGLDMLATTSDDRRFLNDLLSLVDDYEKDSE